jgi:hypothetical protein
MDEGGGMNRGRGNAGRVARCDAGRVVRRDSDEWNELEAVLRG